MTDHVDMNRRNWDERAAIHARDSTGDYMLDRFRAGEDALLAIEAAELGDISGKRVLHLQCHIGLDTLCLARRGAAVTGLDFSRTPNSTMGGPSIVATANSFLLTKISATKLP